MDLQVRLCERGCSGAGFIFCLSLAYLVSVDLCPVVLAESRTPADHYQRAARQAKGGAGGDRRACLPSMLHAAADNARVTPG